LPGTIVTSAYKQGGPKKLHTGFMAITLSTLNHFKNDYLTFIL